MGARARDRGIHRGEADARPRKGQSERSGSRSTGRTGPPWNRASSTRRLGNPLGMAEAAQAPPPKIATEVAVSGGLPDRIAEVVAIDPSAGAIEFEGAWRTWGQLAQHRRCCRRAGRPTGHRGRHPAAQPTIVDRSAPRRAARRGMCRDHQPRTRSSSAPAKTSRRSTCRSSPVSPTTSTCSYRMAPAPGRSQRAISARHSTVAHVNGERGNAHRAGVAVRMLTSGTTGAPETDRPHVTRRSSACWSGRSTTSRIATPSFGSDLAWRSSTHRSSTSVASSACCSASATAGRSACSSASPSTDGSTRCAGTGPRPPASFPLRCGWCSRPTSIPTTSSSLRSVVSGTAPLDPDDADAFMAKYGVPVLVSYAATEFGGGVAGWNIDDHRDFWATKRGSVGRAHAGCELRVVDPRDGDAARRRRRGPARGEGRPAR